MCHVLRLPPLAASKTAEINGIISEFEIRK